MTVLTLKMWPWLVVLFSTLLSTGCWESAGLDNIAYIHEVAVSYQRGVYSLYATILNIPVVTETSEKAMSEKAAPVYIVQAQGKSWIEAVNNMFPTSPKRLMWSQFTTLILHESLLKGHFLDVIDPLLRYREIRPTVWVYGTRAPLARLLQAKMPLEPNPLYTYINNPSEVRVFGRVFPPVRIHTFLRELNEPGRSPLLPELSMNMPESVTWYKERKEMDFVAVSSVGVFSNRRFAGWMPRNALPGLMWARTKGKRIPLYIHHPLIATVYLNNNKVKIDSVQRHGRTFFTLSIQEKADLAEQSQEIDIPQLTQQIQTLMAQDVMKTYRAGVALHSDVLGLGQQAYRRYGFLWPLHTKTEVLRSIRLRPDSLRRVNVKLIRAHSGMRFVTPP